MVDLVFGGFGSIGVHLLHMGFWVAAFGYEVGRVFELDMAEGAASGLLHAC